MFKLVKILNGRINQPEPIRLPAKAQEETLCLVAGSVLKLTSGKLENCGATDKPAYLCAESCTLAPYTEQEVCVFPITPDMVFEVPTEDASALTVGKLYTLAQTIYDAQSGRSFASGVTATTENGVACVFDRVDPTGDNKKIRVMIPA